MSDAASATALPADFIADGHPFENPSESADKAYAGTAPSFGAELEADVGSGVSADLARAGQRGQQQGSSWFDRLLATPDVDTAAGMVAGGQDPYAQQASPTISADDANKRFAPSGTTITDGPMSEGLARVVGQQKADEIKRDSVLSRYAASHGAVTNLGVGAVGFVLDPLQAGTMFIPGIGEETIAAHLGEGVVARTAARGLAGASAGAASMAPIVGLKYAGSLADDGDYGIRDAMYDLASGSALGALGHAGFGALREGGILRPDGLMDADRARAASGLEPAVAPTGSVSDADLASVADAPAYVTSTATNAAVAQMADGREIDVAPIFDQVRADRAEADLQRWTAQQGRLDAQSTAALQASGVADATAGTVESRAAVLQTRLDDLRNQHAGFVADIERTEAQRTSQTDTATPERLQAIDAEMADPGIPAARRQQLEGERSLLTEGRDSTADDLEAARTEAELRGLQRGAAAVEADIAKTTAKIEPLQTTAAAHRLAGSDALNAVSDRVGSQETILRSLAARSIRRYAGAFGAGVARNEADAMALRALRGGPDAVAKVVAEIRGRIAPTAAAARSVAAQSADVDVGPPITQQRAVIANDVVSQLVAAGRSAREAKAAGRIVAAHYEARASRFGGALGTAEELYRQRGAEIRGPDAAPGPRQMSEDARSAADAARFASRENQGGSGQNQSDLNATTNDSTGESIERKSGASAEPDEARSPPPGAPNPGDLSATAEPEIAPGEPAAPEPGAVEQVAADVLPEAVEPVRAVVDAEDRIADTKLAEVVQPAVEPVRAVSTVNPAETAAVDFSATEGPRPLPTYSSELDATKPRGKDLPAGVFMFDPLALSVDATRFQFKSGGDEQGVTSALRGVTQWDPAKAQSIMVWEQADGRLFVADGHQRAGLARRLTGQGQTHGIQLPGVLYRERDGVSDADARAMAAVTNIANGSGSALDGAKVLRARPDLMDGSVPLSAGKGQQAAALARLDDEAFRMVFAEIVPENYGAVVGQVIPADGARQVAALKAIARFEPRSIEEATALTQRVSSAELTRAEEGRQTSLFGDLDEPESTAGEEMRIVARVIKDLRRDRGLFSRVVANASRLEEAGSTIERGAARSAATDAGAFAKILSADAYTAGPTRTTLIEAARDLRDGKASIGDASGRLYAAVRRQAEEDGPDRLGARRGDAASQGDAVERVGGLDFGDRRISGGSRLNGRAGAAADTGRSTAAGDPAALSRRSGGPDASSAGRETRQGAEAAAARARRGDPGSAARDGDRDLLGRLIGDEAASHIAPLDDRSPEPWRARRGIARRPDERSARAEAIRTRQAVSERKRSARRDRTADRGATRRPHPPRSDRGRRARHPSYRGRSGLAPVQCPHDAGGRARRRRTRTAWRPDRARGARPA